MVRRCAPESAKVFVYSATAGRKRDEYVVTLATRFPSRKIAALPRVGPTGPIHAIALPVKAMDA
jgi:hypothetical protein